MSGVVFVVLELRSRGFTEIAMSNAVTVAHPFPKLEVHPDAPKFPRMSAESFDSLVMSILIHGLKTPVVVVDGKLFDGLNRYLACQMIFETKGENHLRIIEVPSTEEAQELSLANNLSRRHLKSSQRAMIGAVNEEYFFSVAKLRPRPGEKSSAVLARYVGVGSRLMQYAISVRNRGPASLVEAVIDGRLAVEVADQLSKSYAAEEIDLAIADAVQATKERFGSADNLSQQERQMFSDELRRILKESNANDFSERTDDTAGQQDAETRTSDPLTFQELVFGVEQIIAAYAGSDEKKLREVASWLRNLAVHCDEYSSPPQGHPVGPQTISGLITCQSTASS